MEPFLVIWAISPLIKVFPDTLPPKTVETVLRISAATNEWESGQLALRSRRAVARIAVEVSDLKHVDDSAVIGPEHVRLYWVDSVPIEHNTPDNPPERLVRKAPARIPEVLRPGPPPSLEADQTRTVWLSLFVPRNKPPGVYRGEVRVTADDTQVAFPVELTVFDFEVPTKRHLFVTNWFNIKSIARFHQVELWSEPFFDVLKKYAENMAEHRQNVFWVSPWLIQTTREPDGRLAFDYARFDRYVELFLNAGVNGRIEIQQVGGHGEGGWTSREIRLHAPPVMDRATGERLKLSPEEALGPFLADLERHLKARGWLDRAMIHICDEPAEHNADSYRRAADFVHQHAPRIKRIEAIEASYFQNSLDVWVPKLSHLRSWHPKFEAAQRAGNELWYYICCHPTGGYLNRFMDYELIRIRLLHWLNYRYGLTGYLHWGLNFWQGDDPFGPPAKQWPPGDSHVIYPGEAGPLNSIRWETQRDSMEDYEYLWLLEQRCREAARELGTAARQGFDPLARPMEYARRLVRDFLDYEQDVPRFTSIREALAREIQHVLDQPLVLVTTSPPEDTPLAMGPIWIEVDGFTHADARVRINGRDAIVRPDGTFRIQVNLSPDKAAVTVHVERGERSREITRAFAVIDP